MRKENPEFYLRIGLEYLQDEKHEGAISFLNSAIRVDPNLAEAYQFRGIAHFALGNYQAALDDYNTALSLDSTLHMVYVFRALYFIEIKLYHVAIEDLSLAIQLNKHCAEAYFFRGGCKGMVDDLKGGTFDIMAAAQLGMREAQKTLNERGIPW